MSKVRQVNIKALIAALCKVIPNEFDISSEYSSKCYDGCRPKKTDFSSHVCGTTACAAGFGALDPVCNSLGLLAEVDDENFLVGFTYKGILGAEAMAKFLGISTAISYTLFAYDTTHRHLYNKHTNAITVRDVIYQLEFLRLTGELHWGHNATSKFTMADAMEEAEEF